MFHQISCHLVLIAANHGVVGNGGPSCAISAGAIHTFIGVGLLGGNTTILNKKEKDISVNHIMKTSTLDKNECLNDVVVGVFHEASFTACIARLLLFIGGALVITIDKVLFRKRDELVAC